MTSRHSEAEWNGLTAEGLSLIQGFPSRKAKGQPVRCRFDAATALAACVFRPNPLDRRPMTHLGPKSKWSYLRAACAAVLALLCLSTALSHAPDHYQDLTSDHHGESDDTGASACVECVLFALTFLSSRGNQQPLLGPDFIASVALPSSCLPAPARRSLLPRRARGPPLAA